MRSRIIATFTLGVAATVSGCVAPSPATPTDGAAHPERVSTVADRLPAFQDCERLRRWYVRAALAKVGPWGLEGPPVVHAQTDSGTLTRATAVGVSGTGTNVQERDVDESDVAKTDGRIVVRVSGRQLVITDVTGARPREVSRTTLPGPLLARPELLLRDGRVLVVGSRQPVVLLRDPVLVGGDRARTLAPQRRGTPRTRIVTVDVGDPARPLVTRVRSIDGTAVSVREYADGVARVVVDTRHPDLRFVAPGRGRTAVQATAQNRQIVRTASVRAWLPTLTSSLGREQDALDCSDVRHPERSSGLGTVTVLSLDPGDDLDATAVTTTGDLVYSSATRLYAATIAGSSTVVHAFALEGGRTSYVGSGSVPGRVESRWSFSEYDGHLRVATALGTGWQPRENAVVVLTERDGRLVRTGVLDGLGRGERIESVRWLGDLAVLVTFRRTDPLYTLDLSQPSRPRVVGRLRIPGYSAYLHPVGGDLVLGLGQDADRRGQVRGAQAATFDLRDHADVRRLDTTRFGAMTDLAVETDPRAFSYLPEQRTFVTAVQDWTPARTRFVAVHVTEDGTLTRTGSWSSAGHTGYDVRVLPLGAGRVALVDEDVRVVTVG